VDSDSSEPGKKDDGPAKAGFASGRGPRLLGCLAVLFGLAIMALGIPVVLVNNLIIKHLEDQDSDDYDYSSWSFSVMAPEDSTQLTWARHLSPLTLPLLMSELSATNDARRRSAGSILLAFDDAIPHLVRAIKDGRRMDESREDLLRLLGEFDEKAGPAMLEIAEDDGCPFAVRVEALDNLSDYDDLDQASISAVIQQLTKLCGRENSSDLIDFASAVSDFPQGFDALKEVAARDNTEAAALCIWGLGFMDHEDAANEIRQYALAGHDCASKAIEAWSTFAMFEKHDVTAMEMVGAGDFWVSRGIGKDMNPSDDDEW
jgi:hypothetical protein